MKVCFKIQDMPVHYLSQELGVDSTNLIKSLLYLALSGQKLTMENMYTALEGDNIKRKVLC